MKQIQSMQNSMYKEWRKLEQKKWRDRMGQVLIEGPHLIEEALKTDQVVAVIMNEDTSPPYEESREHPPLFQLSSELFASLSSTETPQGMMAVIQLKKTEINWSKSHYLLIDAIQDPGNLGTIIRTADAAGFDYVVLGKGTVDAYNAKTLRSAQGSHFHLPIIQADLEDVLPQMKQNSIAILGTSLEGTALTELNPPKGQKVALIMGNEGAGVQKDFLSQADQLVKIPLYGQAESLNVAVATGILVYWLRGL